jgi:hypothetical protein
LRNNRIGTELLESILRLDDREASPEIDKQQRPQIEDCPDPARDDSGPDRGAKRV